MMVVRFALLALSFRFGLSLLESSNSIITIFQIYDTIQKFSFSSSYLSLCIFHFLFGLTTSPAASPTQHYFAKNSFLNIFMAVFGETIFVFGCFTRDSQATLLI